jgi:hypothetical protein
VVQDDRAALREWERGVRATEIQRIASIELRLALGAGVERLHARAPARRVISRLATTL